MSRRTVRGPATALVLACVVAWVTGDATASAQQPFVVDDAEVTAAGVPHVEISTQVDSLKPAARPSRWQNVFETEVAMGLHGRLEAAVLVPVISLMSQSGGSTYAVHGAGDSSLALKWRATRDPRARVSWAGSAFLELPTGSARRGLGSALIDYGVNLVSQVLLTPHWTLRGNLGGVFAGNLQTGAVGITARGGVVTGGASPARAMRRAPPAGAITRARAPHAAPR